MLCGDVELNPWPNKKLNSWFNFSICHWNLNSLTTNDFQKVNVLEADNTVNKFDIIGLTESFLDSSILTENNDDDDDDDDDDDGEEELFLWYGRPTKGV